MSPPPLYPAVGFDGIQSNRASDEEKQLAVKEGLVFFGKEREGEPGD